ncbi:GNAT family N-acetyltransferase [Marinicrinis lubricantis]|uniref:GNAT family N-acetyltransferase n=1 Tax=Marinicrinis lubricantis TaxID=2086470 RepID=A0ABW1IRQ3_9BACL
MFVYRHQDIAVRRLTEEDAPTLVKWLSDKRVLKYYEGRDRPHDLKRVLEHYFEQTSEVTPCIVQYKSVDIGYIQFYPILVEELQIYGYSDFTESIYGMDQFIGEVDYWNRGIGTKLIQSMVTYLLEHEQADKIVMDPQAWNQRALHVYEKCGFRKVKLMPKHEWHEGEYRDCWLIEYDKNRQNSV